MIILIKSSQFEMSRSQDSPEAELENNGNSINTGPEVEKLEVAEPEVLANNNYITVDL